MPTSAPSNSSFNADTVIRALSLVGVLAVAAKLTHSIYLSQHAASSSKSASALTANDSTSHSKLSAKASSEDKDNVELHETLLYEVGPYSHLTPDTLEYILEQYNLGNMVSHRVLKGGLSNSNYRVDTDASPYTVLVKVCDNKTLEELRVQVNALNILKDYHIPIAYPIAKPRLGSNSQFGSPTIRSTAGNADDVPAAPLAARKRSTENNRTGSDDDADRYLLQLAGHKPIILYDYIHGDWVRDPTPAMLSDVGIALAKLHSVPVNRFAGVNLPPFPMGITVMEPMLERVKQTKWKQHEFVAFLEQRLASIKPLLDKPLPQAVCHFDMFVQNVMFAGQKLLAFIDLEEMGIGPAIIDVAMAINGMCYEPDDTLDVSLVTAFLKAYISQRKITSAERELLPRYLEYACLAIGAWRWEQFNIKQPDQLRQDSYLSMVRRINTIDAKLLKSLC